MSRAFRDTFKQTFCFCQKFQHRDSEFSFALLSLKKQPPDNACSSIDYDGASKYRISLYQPTSKPSVQDNINKKKQMSLPFFNRSTAIPLIKDDKSYSPQKHYSLPS